jgi:hypothetical protein
MFHEIGHGLGIRHTVTGGDPVREALKDLSHPVEECKAHLLSIFLPAYLNRTGDLSDAGLKEAHVTLLANMLRLSDSRQGCMVLNYFKEKGAFSRDPETKTYRAHLDRMQSAIDDLTAQILRLQGDGDQEKASLFIEQYGHPDGDLDEDFQRYDTLGNPIEIVLEQE